MEAEDVRSSFLATTVHLQEDLELSSRDRDAAQAVSDGLRDAKAANTRRVYKPHGTSSASGLSSPAGNQCPPSPRQSPSTSATWPPSRRPGPRSPTPMPPRAYRRAITPPAIRPWPRSSRGWRNQAPAPKQADALTTDALALSDVLERTFTASYHRKIRLTETHQGSRQ